MYGDVYLKCPLSGDVVWFNWCSFEYFQLNYIHYDMVWVASN